MGVRRIDYLPVAWETLRVENVVSERRRHGHGLAHYHVSLGAMRERPANTGLPFVLCFLRVWVEDGVPRLPAFSVAAVSQSPESKPFPLGVAGFRFRPIGPGHRPPELATGAEFDPAREYFSVAKFPSLERQKRIEHAELRFMHPEPW